MEIEYRRDGPGFYYRCYWLGIFDEDYSHTSEIEAQIYRHPDGMGVGDYGRRGMILGRQRGKRIATWQALPADLEE